MHSLFYLPLLASLASAISITNPTSNSTHPAGSSLTVTWDTVNTDPSHLSLYLWNFVSWPPSYVPLAIDIPTEDESATVTIPCDTEPEWGYQISAINGTNVYIIYAQGEKFTVGAAVDGKDCVDGDGPSATPSPSPSTCDATTVYVTVSPTASPSSSHHVPMPSPTTTATATSTATSTSKYTKPGIVPKTIGWCSDYSHPVTLDHPPVPTEAPDASTAAPVPVITVTTTTTIGVPAPEGDERCLAA